MIEISVELFALAEFDPSYSKEKLIELKKNHRKILEPKLSQNDYLALFHEFPIVKCVIKILFNYQMMIDEFEQGSNPFFETTKKLKQHPERLDKTIKEFESSLNVSRLLGDKETASKLERAVKVFKNFRNDPNDLIKKLHFFKVLDMTMEDKKNPLLGLILQWNPFDDSTLKELDECIFYIEMKKFFDGFDVSSDMLLNSTSIKIHKLFELNDSTIFSKSNNPSEIIESIFNKIGKTPKINFDRLKYVYPKTFFRDIAIFDYCDESKPKSINEYFERAIEKTIDFSIAHDKFNNIKTNDRETYYSAINDMIERLTLSLLEY